MSQTYVPSRHFYALSVYFIVMLYFFFFFFLSVVVLFSCFPVISDASKKWQEKADLLTRLESQVKRMKENFDAKERSLLEERQKAMEAHKYETICY